MQRLKTIYITNPSGEKQWTTDICDAIKGRHDLTIFDETAPIESQFADVDVVLDSTAHADRIEEMLAAAPNLKLWQAISVGVDLFDMDMFRKAGVPVCNCPGSTSSPGLAEGAIMLMLMIVKKYNQSQEIMHQGGCYTPMGTELDGLILGLIGLGASGQALARLAIPFGLQVMIIEPMPIEPALLDEFNPIFVGKPDELDKVITEADILSLHLPLNAETHQIIDAGRIGLMKPTSIFINVARGDLADQGALYAALMEGRIAAIGTDVHAGRKPDYQHPVYQHPDFYALPHITGSTTSTITRRTAVCAENVDRIAEGLEPKFRVDSS